VVQAVEHLPSKHEAVSSNSSPPKTKNKTKLERDFVLHVVVWSMNPLNSVPIGITVKSAIKTSFIVRNHDNIESQNSLYFFMCYMKDYPLNADQQLTFQSHKQQTRLSGRQQGSPMPPSNEYAHPPGTLGKIPVLASHLSQPKSGLLRQRVLHGGC
jgi:hypothetical protein